ncbi:MAG TPA: TA system VapC family ribonuclease toxin [Solirubrobacteraceae bacterium]|nr:TA system VapC family ribonuclease toxin [Solirubrobacteraceae bacterium]
MSVTVDANVLLYASNADDELHRPARELVERLASGPDLLYLFWPAVMGFLRIATHPAILPSPIAPKQAMATVAALLIRPTVRTEAESRDFWETYTASAGQDARGNHVPDAHLAALMRSHGVKVIYTRDRDFRRYDWIEPRNPFS